jgi:hypothetical protein
MSSRFYLAEPRISPDKAAAAHHAPENQASFSSITPLELSTLWAVVERVEWNVRMKQLFPVVSAEKGGQHTVHEIPAEVIERLARLSMEEIVRVAREWSATLEMKPRAGEVGAILVEVIRLAARSRVTKRRMFLANRLERR